jgi:SepF-like predicted cell division protein (DUF552 family)
MHFKNHPGFPPRPKIVESIEADIVNVVVADIPNLEPAIDLAKKFESDLKSLEEKFDLRFKEFEKSLLPIIKQEVQIVEVKILTFWQKIKLFFKKFF